MPPKRVPVLGVLPPKRLPDGAVDPVAGLNSDPAGFSSPAPLEDDAAPKSPNF